MNKIDIVHLIEEKVTEELTSHPKLKRELQQILNFLKLLFLDEINFAEDLKWPEWADDKGGKKREWFRKALFKAYNAQCFWTGELLHYNDMEVDHVIPKKKGGPDNFLNYVPCKKRRNNKKVDSVKTNRKLVATLYYVETIFGEKLESQICRMEEKIKRAKRKKKETLNIDDMEKEEHSELFSIFWYDYKKKAKENLEKHLAQDKLQAFFQVHGKILNKSGIRKQLWERFNLEIANCYRQIWNGIINGTGFIRKDEDYRQAIIDALHEIGIQGGRQRLSYKEIKQMGIFSMKKYLELTHFDKVGQERIYRYSRGSYLG